MKHISILGSTGSIGTQALDVIRQSPGEFRVAGLSANSNIGLLKEQIREFKPEAVCVMEPEKADELKAGCDINVYSGLKGLIKVATLGSADTVLTSVVGSIGVLPTIEAIKAKKNIALANKETLVTAGSIVMREVRRNNVHLMPVDSEHSALFQCLAGEDANSVSRLILTCSGGAFKGYSAEMLKDVKAVDALRHPTWDMGRKITIDSATLMNKGFEVIEAHHLYGISYGRIDVLIHPQSIVHSMVEFCDHSVMAQLSLPDMKIPIQYALAYPRRLKNSLKPLSLSDIGEMTFKEPDTGLFPCLSLAYEAGKTGGSMPAVLNAANEVAVDAFLKNKIRFMDIPRIIKNTMAQHNAIKAPEIEDLLRLDHDIKKKTREEISC